MSYSFTRPKVTAFSLRDYNDVLLSQVRYIEILCLHFTHPWDSAAWVILLLGSAASIHRLRLCFSQDYYRSHTPGEFGASTKQLDPILVPSQNSDSPFRTLCIVEFAWYFNDGSDEVLRE